MTKGYLALEEKTCFLQLTFQKQSLSVLGRMADTQCRRDTVAISLVFQTGFKNASEAF